MSKIHVNQAINLSKSTPWSAKNGATRRELILKNNLVLADEDVLTFDAKIGFSDNANTSVIFINPVIVNDNKVFGIFLNGYYGYDVIEGKELYTNSSFGGPGNSESKFGIYEVGTVIATNSYKNRQEKGYYRFEADGWKKINAIDMISNMEITEL